MAKTKRILKRGFITVFGMMGFALGAKVTFQPLYSDVRFQPTDKLHAGCTNSADILFSPQGQKITKLTMVLYYTPDTMEIIRILPSTNKGTLNSKIEYNKIILEVENPIFDTAKDATAFFQLYFKSNTIGKESLILGTGSEAITTNKTYPLNENFSLDFAQVPECEPDIVPPNINLIYPKDTKKRINLDQYFIFDIKDIGKGVDKNSVTISFNGKEYFYGSENLIWNGNYLTFYPANRIPIKAAMDLKIVVTDKQSYGGANKAQSIYNFLSATGMVFNQDIKPMIFRQILEKAKKTTAEPQECAVLVNLYTTSSLTYQKYIATIIQKVGCDLNSANTSLLTYEENLSNGKNSEKKKYINLSVFATLGRVLFLITFTLKIHYLFGYMKHKNANKKLNKNIHE